MKNSEVENLSQGPTGGLFVVGTPIGNLGDFSERAKAVLSRADLVVAEDTRKTGRVLADLGIKKPMLSCPDFNEDGRIEAVLSHLHQGHSVCLVSDAGMPTISDPGFRIVRAAAAKGIGSVACQGPVRFCWPWPFQDCRRTVLCLMAFFRENPGKAKTVTQAYLVESRTIIFFESPHRIAKTLDLLLVELGAERRVVIARELTKTYEEVIRGTLGQVVAQTLDRQWLGEITVVLAGAD